MGIFSKNPRISFPVNMSPKVTCRHGYSEVCLFFFLFDVLVWTFFQFTGFDLTLNHYQTGCTAKAIVNL